jgi:hypothetical protein
MRLRYIPLGLLWLGGAACVVAFWVIPVYRAVTA